MGPCPPTHVQGSRPDQPSQICVRTLASNRARSDTPSLVSGHALAGGGRWDQRPVADPTSSDASSLRPIEVALVGQQVQDGRPDTWEEVGPLVDQQLEVRVGYCICCTGCAAFCAALVAAPLISRRFSCSLRAILVFVQQAAGPARFVADVR